MKIENRQNIADTSANHSKRFSYIAKTTGHSDGSIRMHHKVVEIDEANNTVYEVYESWGLIPSTYFVEIHILTVDGVVVKRETTFRL